MMNENTFKILVLDGGGSKGLYTLGVLHELERYLNTNLSNYFDLIYGTSTGSIISSLIATGKPIEEIKDLYIKLIPEIMGKMTPSGKSNLLKKKGEIIFSNYDFTNLKTDIGIVALNNKTKEPFIFKSNNKQAHGMHQSFVPGFGCSLTDAVLSSSAAYPIFNKVNLTTSNGDNVELVDGGFVANNASLYALVDAIQAYKIPKKDIKLFSVGTGHFVDKSTGTVHKIINWIPATKFFTQIFTASTNTNAKLRELLFPDIDTVRINDSFTELKTNMVEKDIGRLNEMYQLGRKSFGEHEKEIHEKFIQASR